MILYTTRGRTSLCITDTNTSSSVSREERDGAMFISTRRALTSIPRQEYSLVSNVGSYYLLRNSQLFKEKWKDG